jgi:drug/metabolite transporter (DMT)-like permease
MSGGLITLSALMPLYILYFPPEYMMPTTEDWMWLLVLSWLCSVLAFQLSAMALKKLTAFTVNLSFNLEPVYGILLAFAIFGESGELSWSFFAGFALIAVSLIIHIFLLLKKEQQIVRNAAE